MADVIVCAAKDCDRRGVEQITERNYTRNEEPPGFEVLRSAWFCEEHHIPAFMLGIDEVVRR